MNASTRGERRAARLNDPRLDWARTPATRRRLVIAMIALLVVEAVVLLGAGALGGPLASRAGVLGVVAVFGLLVVAFVVCFGVLKAATRGVEELDPALLDERQQQVRGVVYAQAYRIGSVLLIAALVLVALWDDVVGPPPPSGVVGAAMVLALHVVLVLPTLVAAWHERV